VTFTFRLTLLVWDSIVLKGGRLVALAGALLQVAKHVDLKEIKTVSSEMNTESSEESKTLETN